MTDELRLLLDDGQPSPDSITADLARASDLFPSVPVPQAAMRLHVYEEGGSWFVWLNTEINDFDGLCIAVGLTREEAIQEATASLEACLKVLQFPPAHGGES